MGDGIYYTSKQFIDVIFFTIIIIYTLINVIFSFYKIDKCKFFIGVMGIALLLSFLSNFTMVLLENKAKISLFYNFSLVGQGIYLFLIFIFFINNYKENPVIKIGLLLIIVVVISFTLKWQKMGCLFMAIYHNVLCNSLIKYKVSHFIFSNVKKLIGDYVFIVDIHGNIVYRSDKVLKSKLFKEVGKISEENINDIFSKKPLCRDIFFKKVLKIQENPPLYFQYSKKNIYDKKNLVGNIITFTDISQLINMLDQLEKKGEEIFKINTKLIKYKEKVYEVEREKEINMLLNEIAQNQEKSMLELKISIEKLNLNNSNFLNEINKCIHVAKSDLKNVREAVTAYINYYE